MSGMKNLHIQYFAILREQAGVGEESLRIAVADPAALYAELAQRHPFKLRREQLKVAVNAEFSSWDRELHDGDKVVFIPPVAGG